MDFILKLPFTFLRVPQIDLPIPKIPKVSPMTIFSLIFISYFIVVSGVIYDVITESPSIGNERDQRTGAIKPVVFLKYRVNGQYIIEGLSAGMLFSLGGLAIIALDKSVKMEMSNNARNITMISGIVVMGLAYMISIVFLRIKIPGYGY